MTSERQRNVTRALEGALGGLVADGSLTGGCVAAVHGHECAVVCAGSADLARRVPLRSDACFRLASVTKPIIAALALALVEDGVLELDDPIGRWMPELASPSVMRSARGPVDDVVPAAGPVLVRQVLDSTCGWGFPGDLSLPGVDGMLAAIGDGRNRHLLPEPDAWVAALAQRPLMFQPGERWLYDTSYDLLGVLLARAAGRPLPALLAERLLAPLGMRHTGFSVVPPGPGVVLVEGVRGRTGALRAADQADVTVPPRFPSGAGGLVGTIDDLVRFARMLVDGGSLDGAQVLTTASVDAMTADRLSAAQRSEGGGFLAGQSWGYGGMVDAAPREPWQAPGRFGWVGVTGTSLHVRRDEGTALVVLTSRELFEREDTELLEAIWAAAV
jgi:CubicO group peptidase (beta-lactamase class C family)